jgi:PAS domain S-box-containing protein
MQFSREPFSLAHPSRVGDTNVNVEPGVEPEELARSLIALSPNPIFRVRNDGYFQFINSAAVDFFNCNPQDLMGKRFWDFYPKALAVRCWATIKNVIEMGTSLVDESPSEINGKSRWFGTYLQPVKNSRGEVVAVQGIVHDITTRKEAEIQFREAYHQMQLLVQASPYVFYRARAGGNFDLTYASSNVTALLGYAPEELYEQAFWSCCVHPDDAPTIFAELSQVFITGSHSQEYRFRHKDGSWRWLRDELKLVRDDLGNPKEILGTWVGVTERKQAEEVSQLNMVRLAALIDNLQQGVLVENDAREITNVNPMFCELFGFAAPRDLIGKKALEVAESVMSMFGNPASFLDGIEIQRNGRRPVVDEELALLDGRIFVRDYVPIVVQDKSFGNLWIYRDITPLKRTELQRLEMQRRLLQLKKLDSLNVMAGGIAHNYNNLLQIIMGNLELVANELPKNSSTSAWINTALGTAKRAAELTRQMLAYSGREHPSITSLNLSEQVQWHVGHFRTFLGKSVTVNMNLQSDLPLIDADPVQVQQVLVNLLTNASEAISEKKGTITVASGTIDCDAAYLEESLLKEKPKPGGFVYLDIRDTGNGMGEEALQHLFEPFYTTKFHGRGLGLPVVMGIMRAHQGAIFVESALGKGTNVRLLFPKGAPLATPPPPTGTAVEPPIKIQPVPESLGPILVVDDEPELRQVCQTELELLGYRVVLAADGVEAVEIVQKRNLDISCIILDLTMPRMDGLAAFQKIHQIRPDIRIILASGYDRQTALERFRAEGLSGFLQKPWKLLDLQSVLSSVLAGNNPSAS